MINRGKVRDGRMGVDRVRDDAANADVRPRIRHNGFRALDNRIQFERQSKGGSALLGEAGPPARDPAHDASRSANAALPRELPRRADWFVENRFLFAASGSEEFLGHGKLGARHFHVIT